MGLDVKIRRGEEKRQKTRRERLHMKIKKLNEKNHEARRPQNDEKLKKKKDAAKQKDEKI